MKVIIEARINVDGQWWDIDIETSADSNKTPSEKLARLEKIIRGMARTGRLISRVPGIHGTTPQEDGHPSPATGNGATQAAFTWPEPQCQVHREAMMPSKQQKKEGHTMYFCAKRLGEGYCGQRASVENSTAMPKFWEVKQAV